MRVPHAAGELHGTESNAQVTHVLTDTSSTKCPTSVSPKELHAVPIHTGMEQSASVCRGSVKLMESANCVVQELPTTGLNAPVTRCATLQSAVVQTRST